jgi:molybdate transport system substrate-binding protein
MSGMPRRLVAISAVGLALVAMPVATAAAPGREILVFAAASLTEALQEIGTAYERETGVRVVCSFAGSNDLARQIRAGAPADVFVSANAERMDELVAAGLVRPADRFDLLSNALVVIVSVGSSLSVHGPGDLLRAHELALADPEAVPAGIYARRWLERVGWWGRLRGRVVPTLDVRAALAAVDSGAAEAGVVYRTDAAMARRARVAFEVPADEAPRIVYPAAVLVSASPDARPFLERLRSPASRAVFERLGFEVLGER